MKNRLLIFVLMGLIVMANQVRADDVEQILDVLPEGCWVNDPAGDFVTRLVKEENGEVFAVAKTGHLRFRVERNKTRIDAFYRHDNEHMVGVNVDEVIAGNFILSFVQLYDGKVYSFNGEPEKFDPSTVDFYEMSFQKDPAVLVFKSVTPGLNKKAYYTKTASGFDLIVHADGKDFGYPGRLIYEAHIVPGTDCTWDKQ